MDRGEMTEIAGVLSMVISMVIHAMKQGILGFLNAC